MSLLNYCNTKKTYLQSGAIQVCMSVCQAIVHDLRLLCQDILCKFLYYFSCYLLYHLAQILSILFCFFVIFLSKQGCRYTLYNGRQVLSSFRRLCFLVETRGLDSRRLVACSVIAALTAVKGCHSLPLPSIPLCKKQYRLTAAVFFGGNEGARTHDLTDVNRAL